MRGAIIAILGMHISAGTVGKIWKSESASRRESGGSRFLHWRCNSWEHDRDFVATAKRQASGEIPHIKFVVRFGRASRDRVRWYRIRCDGRLQFGRSAETPAQAAAVVRSQPPRPAVAQESPKCLSAMAGRDHAATNAGGHRRALFLEIHQAVSDGSPIGRRTTGRRSAVVGGVGVLCSGQKPSQVRPNRRSRTRWTISRHD